MFLLQILNETDTVPEIANVVVHVRSVREQVEEVRAVATALSGRPIVAVVLHVVHIRAGAAACGRQEDCTSSL